MPNKMDGVSMLAADTLGVKSIVPTMIKSVDVEFFADLVSGVLLEMQEITRSKFVGSWITVQSTII